MITSHFQHIRQLFKYGILHHKERIATTLSKPALSLAG